MKLPNAEHASRPWRIHQLTADFRLLDVWALPTPGDQNDFPRLLQLWNSFDPLKSSSGAVRTLFAIRRGLGKLLDWDRADNTGRRATLRDRLPDDLRGASTDAGPPGPSVSPFSPLYRTDNEWAAELINRTVHGVVHLGWVPAPGGGYRGQMAILVKPNGLLGAAYLAAIAPFRHLIVYPRMLSEIKRKWQPSRSAPSSTPTS